ncbi:MAG: hypothetical protein LBI14_10535 [Treponema sp.]|jgi:hypothetical protein|nr:hypothetical protein [Treponema sp.]
MKKFILVLVLAVLVAGAVFADRPSGFGIGAMGQTQGWGWKGFVYTETYGLAVSLKIPSVPIFWGVHLYFYKGSLAVGVSGDYYLIDKTIIPSVNFGWYFGLGAYAGVNLKSGSFDIHAAARLPVGLYIIPVDFLEVYFAVVPHLGVAVAINPIGVNFPYGGLGAEIGIRFWF